MKVNEIEVHPDVCNGRPVVRGTRIAVESVLGMLAAGDSVDDVLLAFPSLKREQVSKRELVRLNREAILEAASSLGAERIRLFGSVARGDDDAGSDVDFIVKMRPEMDVFDLVDLKDRLHDILGCEVDMLTEHPGMGERLRREIEEAAVEL